MDGGAGFNRVSWRIAAQIKDSLGGREVLASPFLRKYATSQLAVLPEREYAEGLARIESALATAEQAGETLEFPVEIWLVIVIGYV